MRRFLCNALKYKISSWKYEFCSCGPETKNTCSPYTKMSAGAPNVIPLREEGFLPSTQCNKEQSYASFNVCPFLLPTPRHTQHRSPDLIKTQIIKMQSQPTSKPSIQKSTFQEGECRPWMVVMKADHWPEWIGDFIAILSTLLIFMCPYLPQKDVEENPTREG